jgi:hypothetical protein
MAKKANGRYQPSTTFDEDHQARSGSYSMRTWGLALKTTNRVTLPQVAMRASA